MIVPILSALGLIGPELAAVIGALAAARVIIKAFWYLKAAMSSR